MKPCNVMISEEQINKAKEIAADTDNLVIRYLRNKPSLSINKIEEVNEKNGNVIERIDYRLAGGAPYAVMVAFKDPETGGVLVGWAKRHSTKENKSFTKKEARETAVLRALSDKIVYASGKAITSKGSGKPLPSAVAKAMYSFEKRVFAVFNDVSRIRNIEA